MLPMIRFLSQDVTCEDPGSYGPLSQHTWDMNNAAVGSTIQLQCQKGSAFNSASLRNMGFDSTVANMFGPIDLTCGSNGLWHPFLSNVPVCQGTLVKSYVLLELLRKSIKT